MTTWQQKLIALFIPDIKPVVIAYDDDKLLTEESIITALKNKGFDIILSTSLIQTRYEFEKYLADAVQGCKVKTLLIVHQKESDFSLPYDITKNAARVDISFDTLFPNLSSSVLHLLTTEQFSDVYEAYEDEKPDLQFGYDRTCLFLLKNLYRIHPQELKTDNDLIALLIKLHFEGIKIPSKIGDYFSRYMARKEKYTNWQNLSTLLTNSSYFWSYLQTAWENTLFNENTPTAGPERIDFTKNNIGVYIDDVFEKGLMHIREIDSKTARPDLIPEKLFELSRNHDSKEKLRQERSRKILKQLTSEIPSENSSYSDWITYQRAYSEYMFLNSDKDNSELFKAVNSVFVKWIKEHYDSLGFEVGESPVVLPKVVDFLRQKKASERKKIALIVMDGMSYSQWLTVKSCIPDKYGFSFEEKTSMACIPTLTSVSRQSIFSGLYPKFFSSTILKTSAEPQLWEKAWSDVCHPLYLKNNGTGIADEVLCQIMPSNQVVGIVINTIDDLMHSTILGNKEYYDRIKIWMEKSFLTDLLIGLIDSGYNVWITSDHGNIPATGVGTLRVGKLAEAKGARACIMPSVELRNQVVTGNPYSESWDSSILPNESFSTLVAKDNYAFISKNSVEISHGGISIDEVMVPFIRVYRKENDR